MRKFLRTCALLAALVLSRAAGVSATTNYPSVLDTDATLFNLVNGNVYISDFHNNPKDAIIAIETLVGAGTGTPGTTRYKLENSATIDPGHKHTTASLNFSDGSAATPGLLFGNPVTDVNTGFFHPASGSIGISSSGVEIARLKGAGLGIFVADAQFPLDIAGTLRLRTTSSLCFGGTGAGDNDTCLNRNAAHVVKFAGSLIATDQAVGDNTLVLQGIAAKTGKFFQAFLLAADANPAFQLAADGATVGWGPGGASAIDTTLARTGANALAASGALTVGGNLVVNGTGTNTLGGAASTVVVTNTLTVNGTGTHTIGGSAATVNIGATGVSTVTLGNTGTVTIAAAGATTNINGTLTLQNGNITLTPTSTITLSDAKNFVFNATTGTKFGTATTQKIGFWNAAPVAQPLISDALITLLQNIGFIPAGTYSGNIVTTGSLTIGTSGAVLTRYLTGSTTVDIGSITAPLCTDSPAFAVTNAVDGDVCDVGDVAAGWVANSTYACYVSSAGNVKIRECCLTGTCNPGSRTYKISLHQ